MNIRGLATVDFLMSPEVFFQAELLPANETFLVSLAQVQLLVLDQVFSLREKFPTFGTVARSHLEVDHPVSEKIGLLVEGFLTFGTLVRRFPRVDSLVPDQIGPPAEALPTLGAFERVAQMHPLVSEELPVHAEAFPALDTLVRTFHGVDFMVPGEIGFLIEFLTANGAGESFLRFRLLQNDGDIFLGFGKAPVLFYKHGGRALLEENRRWLNVFPKF